MKKEAAADEDGDGELDVLAAAAWSPGWLELLSRRGGEASAAVLATGASEAAASTSASPMEP